MDAASLHITMYPWFAMGHLTPFLHLANKLAKRGHKISFFIPRRTQAKLENLNLHPSLITFVPVIVPHVDGLPYDAETTSDVPSSLFPLIASAMDLTEKDIELLMFPDCSIKLHEHEVRFLGAGRKLESSSPESSNSTLEEKWGEWLGRFKAGSVIYCAFGSENSLQQNQLQELLSGLELTGMPFLAALKPPTEFESIEDALPKGFKERVQERGVLYGGWVQQQLILEHPSIGCFITHCGAASLTEALVNQCQLVLLPCLGSDFINARTMGGKLRVRVEVEKGEEDGLFTHRKVCAKL
ncbi:unnamed protein product [Sphenostylis stenocarpa]|uniref:Uncharacterized protein n=1 Tax=Sphenostylis stenocarpa TaxID=92480 RepID=A0AA86W5A9_9FABA|nr:unnamed protein product [Sphenostylis stenocarpa]